jgi:predicted RNA-binding Zn-ribbon protein involved in translation (DUF1610 family)
METLSAMLKCAADADAWTRVVRRCAWCRRVANEQGEYAAISVLDPQAVVTDGMCPACGRRALVEVMARRGHSNPLAA